MSRTRAWPGVSPLPLIGIVDATVGASAGHHRLGIFATSFTVRSDMRRYLGLDILAKSRLTKITNQNLIDEEVTITAITA